jgi:hypothetical protein
MSIQKSHMEGMNFQEILEGLIYRCCKEDVYLFAVLAKKIWLRHNVTMHGGLFSHQNSLIQEVESMLLHFTGCPRVQERNVYGGNEVPVSWKPPIFRRFKVN